MLAKRLNSDPTRHRAFTLGLARAALGAFSDGHYGACAWMILPLIAEEPSPVPLFSIFVACCLELGSLERARLAIMIEEIAEETSADRSRMERLRRLSTITCAQFSMRRLGDRELRVLRKRAERALRDL
jgi:hypothetical protein